MDNGADADKILAPLMEDFNQEDASLPKNDYMNEIEASAGTYNFPWKHNSQHGFATAMYRTDIDVPDLSLESVRDENGDEIEVNSRMRQELLHQAKNFIGNE